MNILDKIQAKNKENDFDSLIKVIQKELKMTIGDFLNQNYIDKVSINLDHKYNFYDFLAKVYSKKYPNKVFNRYTESSIMNHYIKELYNLLTGQNSSIIAQEMDQNTDEKNWIILSRVWKRESTSLEDFELIAKSIKRSNDKYLYFGFGNFLRTPFDSIDQFVDFFKYISQLCSPYSIQKTTNSILVPILSTVNCYYGGPSKELMTNYMDQVYNLFENEEHKEFVCERFGSETLISSQFYNAYVNDTQIIWYIKNVKNSEKLNKKLIEIKDHSLIDLYSKHYKTDIGKLLLDDIKRRKLNSENNEKIIHIIKEAIVDNNIEILKLFKDNQLLIQDQKIYFDIIEEERYSEAKKQEK
jgi:hypothetical protein